MVDLTQTTAKMPKFVLRRTLLFVVAVAFGGCAGTQRRTPYTESELQIVVPLGVPGVRTWADVPLSVLRDQVAHLPALNEAHEFSILSLSGGGEHGASVPGYSAGGAKPGGVRYSTL